MPIEVSAEEAKEAIEEAKETNDEFVLPEKFEGKSPEEIAKAYVELEKKLGSQPEPEEEGEEKPDEKKAEDKETEPPGFDKYTEEITEHGKLSEASYQELEEFGFNKETVDRFIQMQGFSSETPAKDVQEAVELASKTVEEIKGVAGGEEEYATMMKWASTHLPQPDIEAFNSMLGTGNGALIKLTVQGIKAKYDADMGTDPKLLGKGKPASGDKFESTSEVMAAMRDPRYKKGDEAFIKQVEAKMKRTNIL